ncbi:hypothetical protein AA101099_0076 [Neoasaia chiangmaiensis NBRC 101099]|uniref:hypothetical protein n=1 Tax=Neoasaia chiangmaiensis TaxID=320497 RepID=UPI001191A5DF|nr:hypothetical protein [Neoasaia chiangmaiensis]GBR35567.1 hypothetical protein AA101099_0076 [Neoasaia chiangmaiensis NBRC 101099]GEN16395.1 hypothetical protein NCH01_28260 [Neoasaia chiangmaiensis]
MPFAQQGQCKALQHDHRQGLRDRMELTWPYMGDEERQQQQSTAEQTVAARAMLSPRGLLCDCIAV